MKRPAATYETSRPMPLFYSPMHKVSIDDLFELMRSRYEEFPWGQPPCTG